MRKTLFTLLTICTLASATAQTFTSPTTTDIIAGRLSTGEQIKGKKFVFDYRIYSVNADTTYNRMFVVLRKDNVKFNTNNQFILCIDMGTKTILWQKYVHGGKCLLFFSGDKIINSGEGKTRCYSTKDGSELWNNNETIGAVNWQANTGYSIEGKGINLNTGKIVWAHPIKDDLGWNEVVRYDNDNILISANGIHLINLKDGTGWSYGGETTFRDYDHLAMTAVTSVMFGLVGGAAYYYASAGSDGIFGAYSNIVINPENNNIYYACKNYIVCMDASGKEVWKNNFQTRYATKSEITLRGNDLLLINYGYGYRGTQPVAYYAPFFMLQNRETGKQQTKIFLEEEEYIVSAHFADSILTCICPKAILQYNIYTGALINKTATKRTVFQDYNTFTNERTSYINTNKIQYKPLAEVYPTNLFLSNSKNFFTLRTDAHMNAIDSFSYDRILRKYQRKNETDFVKQGTNTIFIKNNTQTGIIYAPDAAVTNSTLYATGRDYLILADTTRLHL